MGLDAIMIFAAGFGTRLAPLTTHTPKPLVPVFGRAMIDWALDLADDAEISRKIVNAHYLHPQISDHLAPRGDVTVVIEDDVILDTGGGLKNALPVVGEDPIFTLNPDAVWAGQNPLRLLANRWRADDMDALLALVPLDRAAGHTGRGDFQMDADGRLRRFDGRRGVPFVYTSAQILRTDGLDAIKAQVFSMNVLWDRMIAERRLFGVVYPDEWVDVGSVYGLRLAEIMLKKNENV